MMMLRDFASEGRTCRDDNIHAAFREVHQHIVKVAAKKELIRSASTQKRLGQWQQSKHVDGRNRKQRHPFSPA